MTTKTPTIDEDYTKPSKDKQWNEQSSKPVIVNRMNKAEIDSHRRNLVAMYNSADSDVTVVFKKITNKADEDYDDCLELIYTLKCVRFGVQEDREVFKIKIPIPETLKQRAEELRIEKAARARIVKALPAPDDIVDTAVENVPTVTPIVTPVTPIITPVTPIVTPVTPIVTRPVIRKPVTRKTVANSLKK